MLFLLLLITKIIRLTAFMMLQIMRITYSFVFYAASCLHAALHWILTPEPSSQDALPIRLVEDLLCCEEYLNSQSPSVWLRELNVSPPQISSTTQMTVGQRNNCLWAAVRKLRFTASNFGDVLRAVKSGQCVVCFFCNVQNFLIWLIWLILSFISCSRATTGCLVVPGL